MGLDFMLYSTMHSSQAALINRQSLCVLKKNSDGTFVITLEPLTSPIENILKELELKIKSQGTDLVALFCELQNGQLTRQIFEYHSSFCQWLDLAYAGLKYDKQSLTDEFLIGRYTGRHLANRFETYILAFRLHHTYEKCRHDPEILAYSHRIVGWTQPPYNLSPDFSVTFRTNFGYGSASYFATILTYRDIDIIQFSKWISYRIVGQKELINCSKWHSLSDESWYSAMSYVQDACNIFRKSEAQFVKTYLTEECEKLITGLRTILINTKFRFITSLYHFVQRDEEVTLSGDELLVFRAEKISGSLGFISSITRLAHIIQIDNYIKQLENLNSQFLPVINTGIHKITAQLSAFEMQLVPAKAAYEDAKILQKGYDEERESIKKSLQEKGIPAELLMDHFSFLFPEYAAFKKEFDKRQQLYFDLDKAVHKKNRALMDCTICLDTINDYFASKK